eukprot:209028-Rhodomonas_salina.1
MSTVLTKIKTKLGKEDWAYYCDAMNLTLAERTSIANACFNDAWAAKQSGVRHIHKPNDKKIIKANEQLEGATFVTTYLSSADKIDLGKRDFAFYVGEMRLTPTQRLNILGTYAKKAKKPTLHVCHVCNEPENLTMKEVMDKNPGIMGLCMTCFCGKQGHEDRRKYNPAAGEWFCIPCEEGGDGFVEPMEREHVKLGKPRRDPPSITEKKAPVEKKELTGNDSETE